MRHKLKYLFLSLVFGSEESCLQNRIDEYCRNLVKENGLCENFEYGRFDGKKWRCYETLGEDAKEQCVDDDGQKTSCTAQGSK